MSVVNGNLTDHATISRSNSGFPCSALIEIDLSEESDALAEQATIAGIWADAHTAVLSIIFSNYDYRLHIIELIGIETIPVILESEEIHMVLASQEISLNPDQDDRDALLSIDLDNFQFESEIIRLDMPRPGDVYVAVTQNAYFIDVNTRGTINNLADDSYSISGGGQLVEVENNSAEIVQQALIEVYISSSCRINPVSGMALLRVTGVEDEGFPELGTALIEFYDNCQGKAEVFAATGMYIGTNGKKLTFVL